MRIAIFGARGIPAKWGGFDTFVTHLAPRLAEKGHDVVVFCQPKYSDKTKPKWYKGVRLIYLPTIYGKTTETFVHELLSSLYALFILKKFNIYYILGCRSTIVYWLHYLLRRTLIINTDGLDWVRRKWGVVARCFLKLNYAIARKIGYYLVSDSKELKKYYLENYHIETAFLTSGGEIVTERDESILDQYGLKSHDYFLVVCRIEPENNIDIIIREFEKTTIPKKLVIVGGANYKSSYLQKLMGTHDKRIIFLGPVYTEGHIEQIFLHAFVYIHGHEVGGTNPSLLQAMACGNVILAHDVRFNREVLNNDGLLWNKEEGNLRAKLIQVTEDYAYYRKVLPKKYIRRIQDYYTWDKVGEDHELFFRWINKEVQCYRDSF
ncbi:DUF1972 domain-containing protein [bacterium]|nr:DUF1972 domain-containing protein [bacterium]